MLFAKIPKFVWLNLPKIPKFVWLNFPKIPIFARLKCARLIGLAARKKPPQAVCSRGR